MSASPGDDRDVQSAETVPAVDVMPAVCDHPRDQWKFLYTREDWIDGDEDDIYECVLCGKRMTEYVPR